MLQRNLLRQARQATRIASVSSPSSIAQQHYHISSKFPALARARIQSRWYSEGAQAKTTDESLGQGAPGQPEPTVVGGAQSTPPKGDNPLQKDLDAKSKEVVELKVN